MVTLVAFLALQAPVPDRLTPYRRQPVLSVDVQAPGEDTDELRSLIDIQPGYLLSTADLQAAIKRLYALGRFENVSVYAERLKGVVLLHFELTPQRLLGELQMKGVPNKTEMRKALGIGPGSEVDQRTATLIETRARDHLRRWGYPGAAVRVIEKENEDPLAPVDMLLEVDAGEPLRVQEIQFLGTPRLERRGLLSIIDAREGDIPRVSVLRQDKQLLEEAFFRSGFRRAVVRAAQCGWPQSDGPTEPCEEWFKRRLTEEDAGRGVRVQYPIEAGDRIAIEFTGNRLFSSARLLEEWPEPEPRMRGGTLRKLTSDITRLYEDAGHIGTEVEYRGFRDKEHGIVRYLFRIREAPPTRVVRLDFHHWQPGQKVKLRDGAEAIPAKTLEKQVRARLVESLTIDEVFTPVDSKEATVLAKGPRAYDSPLLGETELPQVAAQNRWVPRLYKQALEEIASVYRDKGYLEVQITMQEPVVVENEVSIDIDVVENKQTKIRLIEFEDNVSVPSIALLDEISGPPEDEEEEGAPPIALGGALSYAGVEDARIALVRYYRDNGFLYARVFSNVHRETSGDAETSHGSQVKYRIEEGPQVRVGKILVQGNRFTRERVIRSRLSTEEGNVYRLDEAVADQRAIANLGVFSNVRVRLIDEERPASQKDVVTEVRERNRQPIELSAGVSTAEGVRAGVTYSHINVFGTAFAFTSGLKLNRQLFFRLYGPFEQTLRDRYRAFDGTEQLTKAMERQIRFGIRSPTLNMLPLDPTIRLDFLNERENTVPYSLDTTSLTLGIDSFLSDHVSLSLEPQIAQTDLECPIVATENSTININADANAVCQQAAQDLTRLRSVEEGRRRVFKVGPSITIDYRDNPLNPREGIVAKAEAIYAIGNAEQSGEISFTRLEGNVTGYINLLGSVLVLSLRGGTILDLSDNGVPVDERFYLGGRDTLRGFVEDTIIPEDVQVLLPGEPSVNPGSDIERTRDDNGNLRPPVSRGGNLFVLGKVELRVPLSDSISLDFFVDTGNLWDDRKNFEPFDLRVGTGAGIRYNTPVGALALDVGVNPNPRSINAESSVPQFHFSVGSF